MKRSARKKPLPLVDDVPLSVIAGGGQTLGELPDGKKVFVWGGLPGERASVQLTKQKSSFAEGVVTAVAQASPDRIEPRDPESYLSTSPWQIMSFDAEQRAKAQLVAEAFQLHHITLPSPPDMYSDGNQYGYRNKVEFSWWWDNDTDSLDLAFFKRGSHGKQPVDGTNLARPEINQTARAVRDLLRAKGVEARALKTLLIRCDQQGRVVWQLYVKDRLSDLLTQADFAALASGATVGAELIYSDPHSPASRITERLASFGETVLQDEVLGQRFNYATESFFQVNIPVYEQALRDMQQWLGARPTLDLYSGVGSIGLTIGAHDGQPLTLVEVDEHAVREMERNVANHPAKAQITAVLAASEKALDYITAGCDVIVDPPRAGLHQAVVDRLLAVQPPRIVYLSCNPATQARDISLLQAGGYHMVHLQGYNFFPRTPHIEHLAVLEAA